MKCPLCLKEQTKIKTFSYNNHNNVFKKRFLFFVYNIIFLLCPKSLLKSKKFPKRILLSIWYNSKIITCPHCGLSSLDKLPSNKNLNLWYNTIGNTTSVNQSSDSFTERTISQFKYLKKNIDLSQVRSCLEFGAGNGELSQLLKIKYSIETTAIDISEQSIKYLKRNNLIDHVEKIFPTNITYDIIICSHILHLVDNFPQIINKIENALSPTGYFFIESPNINSEYFHLDGQDTPYLWFINKKVVDYISKRKNNNIIDFSFFGPKWKDYISKGIKHEKPTQLEDSIIFRTILGISNINY
tara:strand:- start:187 stop:1083 length:897 start_codon:yes stop_codon:yes gene_type:complete